jgi:hypothetical protein
MTHDWDDVTGKRVPLLEALIEGWSALSVEVLMLRGPGPDAEPWASRHNTIDLLVLPKDARAALEVLHATDWRYELGTVGALRFSRSAAYIYDGGPALYLNWGIPFTPLPSRMVSGLEKALWERAWKTEHRWFVPERDPLLLYLAVQSSRPGRIHRRYDWDQFCKALPPGEDRAALRSLARRLKLTSLLERSLQKGDAGKDRPGGPALDGAVGSLAYKLGEQLRRRGPRQVRMMAKTPEPGDVPSIARFDGILAASGPPAFCPMKTTEFFLPPAHEKLQGLTDPVVVDAGTGVGAVALAVTHSYARAEAHGTDIDRAALRWAKRNARRLDTDGTHFYRGSLAEPLPANLAGRVDVLFANLPYYPETKYVPVGSIARGAIQGTDEDGLGLYRHLARDGLILLKLGGRLIVQMFAWQWGYFADELSETGYEPKGTTNRDPFVIGWADRKDQP